VQSSIYYKKFRVF